mgnify:CR=1 FL=1|tara:strand:+ start:11769 stop:12419 length:651 start_codon:yes stop_codon:yes gene_type:complete
MRYKTKSSKKFVQGKSKIKFMKEIGESPTYINIQYGDGYVNIESNSYNFGAIEIYYEGKNLKIDSLTEGWLLGDNGNRLILVNLNNTPIQTTMLAYTGRIEIKSAIAVTWGLDYVPASIIDKSSEKTSKLAGSINQMGTPFANMGKDGFVGSKGSTTKRGELLTKLKRQAFVQSGIKFSIIEGGGGTIQSEDWEETDWDEIKNESGGFIPLGRGGR